MKSYPILLLMILLASCKGGQECFDYSKTKASFFNDTGEKKFDLLQTGESLMLAFDGLEPNAPIQAYLLDDQNKEWSYARMFGNKEGKVPPFLFWFHSGVIGVPVGKLTSNRIQLL